MSQINLDHALIALHFVHRPLGDQLALMQHADPVRDQPYECHVVLDHDDRASIGNALEKLCGQLPLTRAHSRDRLRSEEHTSELQSHSDLVCRLLLEKKKTNQNRTQIPNKTNAHTP